MDKLQRKTHPLIPFGVNSNLPLQVSLYFNAFFSPLWMTGLIISLVNKYHHLEDHYKFVNILMCVVMGLVEVGRIYLGYEGNLREKVSQLAGFWMLTLLQLPLTIYMLANVDTIILPMERAVNILYLMFLLVQTMTGLQALQVFIKAQALKFHLATQFHSIFPSDDTEMRLLS